MSGWVEWVEWVVHTRQEEDLMSVGVVGRLGSLSKVR